MFFIDDFLFHYFLVKLTSFVFLLPQPLFLLNSQRSWRDSFEDIEQEIRAQRGADSTLDQTDKAGPAAVHQFATDKLNKLIKLKEDVDTVDGDGNDDDDVVLLHRPITTGKSKKRSNSKDRLEAVAPTSKMFQSCQTDLSHLRSTSATASGNSSRSSSSNRNTMRSEGETDEEGGDGIELDERMLYEDMDDNEEQKQSSFQEDASNADLVEIEEDNYQRRAIFIQSNGSNSSNSGNTGNTGNSGNSGNSGSSSNGSLGNNNRNHSSGATGSSRGGTSSGFSSFDSGSVSSKGNNTEQSGSGDGGGEQLGKKNGARKKGGFSPAGDAQGSEYEAAEMERQERLKQRHGARMRFDLIDPELSEVRNIVGSPPKVGFGVPKLALDSISILRSSPRTGSADSYTGSALTPSPDSTVGTLSPDPTKMMADISSPRSAFSRHSSRCGLADMLKEDGTTGSGKKSGVAKIRRSVSS